MTEEKNTTEGQPSKKSTSRQKSPEKKPKKEQIKPEAQINPDVGIEPTLSLLKKIDELTDEIQSKHLKSFEKEDREKLLQSYEKLIFKMVREINNSRQ